MAENNNAEDRTNELITKNFPKSPVTEAFRSLRTNLSFLSPDNPLRSILVTSSGPGDGKTLVLVNLGVSMAQNGQKIIIIDADIRKPMVHRFFKMTNHTGLSSILTGDASLAEGLKSTEIDNLSVITTGPIAPNPAELLSSKKMDEVLKEAEARADIVLVDAPPAVIVTDPVILASKVDGVLLVVASHETPKDLLKQARENLENVQANIIGTILNKYPVGKSRYYNRYYSHYS